MSKLLLLVLVTLATGSGCAETTVTFLTQAPPGRTAAVDVTTETLTLTRGLAIAFECTEWSEAYAGPCRGLAVTFADDGADAPVADDLPVHLDALAGQTSFSRAQGFDDEQTVAGPTQRAGGVILGITEGTTTLTVTTAGADVTTTVVVTAPPDPADGDGDDA